LLDSTLTNLTKLHQVETLLQLNLYFHFGYSHHPTSFSRADLSRLVSCPASRKATILLHSIRPSDALSDLSSLFSSSGLRDLFKPEHTRSVLESLITPLPPILAPQSSNMQDTATPDSKLLGLSDPKVLKRELVEKLSSDPQFLQLVTVYFQ
jgi:hypothetical protein